MVRCFCSGSYALGVYGGGFLACMVFLKFVDKNSWGVDYLYHIVMACLGSADVNGVLCYLIVFYEVFFALLCPMFRIRRKVNA